jgi:hypothetical protein
MMASWPNLPEPPRFQSLDKPAVTGHDMPEHSNAYKTLKNFIRGENEMHVQVTVGFGVETRSTEQEELL